MISDDKLGEIRRSYARIMPLPVAKLKSQGETTWICPKCGHGKGGDGIKRDPSSRDGYGLKCFNCGIAGDVIDMYKRVYGADFRTACSLAAKEAGIDLDEPQATQPAANPAAKKEPDKQPGKQPETPKTDYSAYYKECQSRLRQSPDAMAYLANRGISMRTASLFGIGFDPESDPAGAGHKAPRIIVPTSQYHYMGRAINSNDKYAKINVKGATAGILGKKLLYDGESPAPVFVVEGAFDAMSIAEAGGRAIALCSTSNARRLLEEIRAGAEKGKPVRATTVIVCGDCDKAGKGCNKDLLDGLSALGIPAIDGSREVCGLFKDANEFLVADKPSFLSAVKAVVEEAGRLYSERTKPDNIAGYIRSGAMVADMDRGKAEYKTGFSSLDARAGGLYPGLYVLAAISSLGKTTMIAQMGDQLATRGTDVLYFSLEQSRLELVSKSLARRVALDRMEDEDRDKPDGAGVTSRDIRRGHIPSAVDRARLEKAKEGYIAAVGDRLSIVEANFDTSTDTVCEYVRRYVRDNKTSPVVIVDYLQVLQPPATVQRQTVRETVDATVIALKRLSRDLSIPVVVISSVNRTNYMSLFDFESLKESGGIEYTADVVWGLQLQCLHEDTFQKEGGIQAKRTRIQEAKAETPRRVELVCLKNRFGISSYSCPFDYYPALDLFLEGRAPSTQTQTAGTAKRTRL